MEDVASLLQLFDEGTQRGWGFLHALLQNSEKQTKDSGMDSTPYPLSTFSKAQGSNTAATLRGLFRWCRVKAILEDALKQGKFCMDTV